MDIIMAPNVQEKGKEWLYAWNTTTCLLIEIEYLQNILYFAKKYKKYFI
jgi:hypothetical protein